MMEPSVLNYIKTQPESLDKAFSERKIFLKQIRAAADWKKIKKVYLFGSGTSYNVSTITEYYIKHFMKIDVETFYPTYFTNHESPNLNQSLNSDDIIFIGISQSGTSSSTIDALKYGKELGIQTVAFTEDIESKITNYSDKVVQILCGKELLPPETKGYTISVLTMYLSVIEIALLVGNISDEEYDQLVTDAEDLINNFADIIDASEEWYERTKAKFINSSKILFLGYGIDYGSALEGMLKVGEMLRYPCIAYELEEYVHGPTMALDSKTSIIIFGSDEIEWDRMLAFRDKFLNHSKRVSVITNKDLDKNELDLVFDYKTNKFLAPIMYTIPIQFLGAKGAKDIGIDTGINPFGESLGHL